MREAGREVGDGLGHGHHERSHLAGVMCLEVDLALGPLQEAEGVGRLLEAQPRRVLRRLRHDGGRVRAERGQRHPVHEVQPQLAIVSPRQVVVAEEVRVGDDDYAAFLVRHRREEPGARRIGGLARPQHDRAGVVGRQRPGTVEAGLVDAVQEAGIRRRGRGFSDDPGRHAVTGVVVEDDGVLEPHAERRQQLAEVTAVLVLFFLAEDDEAAAAGDERVHRGDLGRREDRRLPAHGALPLGIARMGDHEHVGAGQRYLIERATDGRRDLEVPARELAGRGCV